MEGPHERKVSGKYRELLRSLANDYWTKRVEEGRETADSWLAGRKGALIGEYDAAVVEAKARDESTESGIAIVFPSPSRGYSAADDTPLGRVTVKTGGNAEIRIWREPETGTTINGVLLDGAWTKSGRYWAHPLSVSDVEAVLE